MKTRTAQSHKWGALAAASAAALFVTSCATTSQKECADNVNDHLPFISCQPVDRMAKIGFPASFSVKASDAQGHPLSYLWYNKPRNSCNFIAMPGKNGPTLDFTSVQASDFGLYFCAIGSETPDGLLSVVQSRAASLGGLPDGAGGVFIPCDWPVSAGTAQPICGHTVSGSYDRFPTNEVAPANMMGLTCQIKNLTKGTMLSSGDYYLQWLINSAHKDCMYPVSGTTDTVGAAVTPGSNYHFTAFFVPGHVPDTGDTLELSGIWLATPPPQ